MMALVSGVRKRFIRLGETLRIVLVVLGDGGEAAHVAEQNGHAPFLAAEHQLFRRFRQLLDQRRRQVKAERRADLLALPLFAEIIDERKHQINQPARHQRIGEVDEQAVGDEEVAMTSAIIPAINASPSATTIEAGNIGAAMMMARPKTTATTISAPIA